MQALLFSPHADEAAVLTLILQQAGFAIRSVRNLDLAIESWPEQPSDFILITLSDTGAPAQKQIKQMRAHTAAPILVIVDQPTEDVHVALLQAGVDLLVVRPYSPRILLNQIRALLRRTAGMPFFSLPTLSRAGVTLDPATRTVRVDEEEPNHLTQLEFRLLYTLMTHAGQIIPAENIVEHVWGYTGEGNRELVRGLVQRLRSKVEPDPRNPKYILTEPGVGYYFNRFD